MIVKNEDVKEVVSEIPEGHAHLRTTIILQDGTEFVFQEATIASLVRAYISVKTHPTLRKVQLKRKKVSEAKRKKEFAEWQLLEEKPANE